MFKNFQKKLLLILFVILLSIIGYLTWTPNPEQTSEEADPHQPIPEIATNISICAEFSFKDPMELINFLQTQSNINPTEWENKKFCGKSQRDYFSTLKKFEIDWSNKEIQKNGSTATYPTFSTYSYKGKQMKIVGPVFTFEQSSKDQQWRVQPKFSYPCDLYSPPDEYNTNLEKSKDEQGINDYFSLQDITMIPVKEPCGNAGVFIDNDSPWNDLKNDEKILFYSDGTYEPFPSKFVGLRSNSNAASIPFFRSLLPLKNNKASEKWIITGKDIENRFNHSVFIDLLKPEQSDNHCKNLIIENPTSYKTYESKTLGASFYQAIGSCVEERRIVNLSFGIILKDGACKELEHYESECDSYSGMDITHLFKISEIYTLGFEVRGEEGTFYSLDQYDPNAQTLIQPEKSKE